MKTLPIVKTPDPLLKERSKEITIEQLQSKEMQEFLDVMIETMIVEDGIGLAAPQVGKSWRIIVVTRNNAPEVFINPEITQRSLRKVKVEEGCLSVPGLTGMVQRHRGITLKALNRNGNEITVETDDFTSVIFQHEIDHLDGILFTDRASKLIPQD